jgi:hypothetical protein
MPTRSIGDTQSLTKLIPLSDPIQTGVLYNEGRVIRRL